MRKDSPVKTSANGIAPGILEPQSPEQPFSISTDELFAVIGQDKMLIGRLQQRIAELNQELVAQEIRRVAAEQRADAYERQIRAEHGALDLAATASNGDAGG